MAKTILLSIHARYAHRIFTGEKTVELRRVLPHISCGDKVLVYVTSPQMEVVGEFIVKRVLQGSPADVWKAAGAAACVSGEEYDRYFRGAANAVGILIAQAQYFPQPISLAQLRKKIPGFHPPQVHRYITSSEYARLLLLNAAA